MKRWVARAADAALFAAVSAGLVIYGRRYIPGALDAMTGLPTGRLVVCSALALAGYCLRFGVWHALAGGFGLRTSLSGGARAFFVSYLGRYVPGNAGLLLARVRAYGGSSPGTVTLATAVEYASITASALLLIGLEAGMRLSSVVHGALLPLLAAAIVIAVLHPSVLERLTGLVWRLFRRSPPKGFPPWRRMALLTGGYVLVGVMNGAALLVLLQGFADLSTSALPSVVARYYIAGLAGGLTAFAPAGLGVREGLLVATLDGVAASENALAAALTMRLVTVVLELALAGASTLAAGVSSHRRDYSGG